LEKFFFPGGPALKNPDGGPGGVFTKNFLKKFEGGPFCLKKKKIFGRAPPPRGGG